MDTTKIVLMVATVVVAAALVRTSSGQAQQPRCFGQLEEGCNDTDTGAGQAKCCQTVDSVFRTDVPCLCMAFKAINYPRDDVMNFLAFCNVTSDSKSYPCESTPLGSGLQTVAPTSGPKPPSSAPSPSPDLY